MKSQSEARAKSGQQPEALALLKSAAQIGEHSLNSSHG